MSDTLIAAGVDTRAAVLGRIRAHQRNRPRTLQTTIGPSQLGGECEHCLAARLAGWRARVDDGAWMPFIGTAVHAELAGIFDTDPALWLTETPVMVGWVGDKEIWGSADLYSVLTATVVDYKVVGAETLRAAKSGPSNVYRSQVHLYGQGFVNAGRPVRDVAICYLPRNAVSLDAAVWWQEPFDPDIAAATLARADRIATTITQLQTIHPDAANAYITGLPRAVGCYDCARFPDAPTTPSPLHQFDTTKGQAS